MNADMVALLAVLVQNVNGPMTQPQAVAQAMQYWREASRQVRDHNIAQSREMPPLKGLAPEDAVTRCRECGAV